MNMSMIPYEDKKRDFAFMLLQNPDDVLLAAKAVAGSNANAVLYIVSNWPDDKQVLEYRKELITKYGEEYFLPSKAKIARAVWEDAQKCPDPDARIKFYKLYSDLLGYVKENSVNINNTVVNQNRVMQVQVSASDKDWENEVLQQQTQLMIECESINERTIGL